MLALIGPLGTPEVLIIVLILLLLFGAKKLPELLRSMGEGVKEFRKASREIMEDIEGADSSKRSRTYKAASKPTTVPPVDGSTTTDKVEEASVTSES